MKVLRISVLSLMVFSLMTGICYGQTARDYYYKAIDYAVVGKFEEAQEELTKALAADPFYAPARICLRLSEDALKQRIKTETALYLFKGTAYLNEGMLDEAIAEFKKAIRINPEYADAHNNLGNTYLNKGMLDEAIAEFKKALEINPDFAEAHGNLGETHLNKGVLDEAIAELKKALEIDPEYADARCILGVAYANKGMLDEAIAEYKKAIEINPNLAMAHMNLALAYYYKGEYSLATKHRDRLMELGYEVDPELLKALEPYRER